MVYLTARDKQIINFCLSNNTEHVGVGRHNYHFELKDAEEIIGNLQESLAEISVLNCTKKEDKIIQAMTIRNLEDEIAFIKKYKKYDNYVYTNYKGHKQRVVVIK